MSSPNRHYDKGERRKKHVGTGPNPTIELDDSDPKRWIGKCPSTITAVQRLALLSEALPGSNGDRELEAPKRLYVVHEGAIYEAQTSDHGQSYHAYPYKGKLSGAMLKRLEEMAQRKNCEAGFKSWVKAHIERHGERK
ncbi:hypothetical protein [Rhizobium sp. A37_96]